MQVYQANRVQLLTLLLLSLALAVWPAGAMYEWIPPGNKCDSVHSYTPAPYDGVPPPMPGLPNQYTMNIQANILQKAWSSEVTEHYDGPNNKASVFLTFNGTTTQTIFNYKTMETHDIYPDGTCKTRSGQTDYFGFFKMDHNHRPVKSTVYEMFHMGPKQKFTYVGNTWVRGIRVNHWTSCQEWPDFASKFQLDYYFSHEDYQTAWGTGQIPIRAVVNGSAGNEDQNRHPMFGRHKFEHIYDFTAFNTGPIKDQTVFHLPHDVVCMGSKDHKPVPNLPDNFQMDLEMSCPVMGGSVPFQKSFRYDWEHHLTETYMNIPGLQGSIEDMQKMMMEHTLVGGGSQADMAKILANKKLVMRSISSVDDHSTGLRYVTEKMNNTCRVSAMPEGSDAMPMNHGRSLFDIHYEVKTGSSSSFTYQGRSTFRNMPVDVWGTEAEGMIQKVFFLADDKGDRNVDKDKFTDNNKQPGASPSNYLNQNGNPMAGSNAVPPSGNLANTATGQNATNAAMPGKDRAEENTKENAQPTNIPNGLAAEVPSDIMKWLKKHQDQMGSLKSNTNSKSSGSDHMPMMTASIPYPVLVGMVFRNRTAISTRSMPTFFQEVMQPELVNWKERMSREYLSGLSLKKSEGTKILDQHAMMEQMAAKVARHVGEIDMNVFHFQPLHTDESMFQVAHCYEPEQTNHVLLHVDAPFKKAVLRNKAAFSMAMRKGIADAMGVSYIQISNLKPQPHIDTEKNIDATYVTFTLLGSPPVKAPKIQPPSITVVRQKLLDAIRNGISFKVNYPTHTKSFLVDKNGYSLDSKMFERAMGPESLDATPQRSHKDSDDSINYSPASVAGIAIGTLLLGVIIALVVLLFIRKRQNPEEPAIPYKITKS